MKILDYEYNSPSWKFHQLSFQKVNLIVGDSGTGKTRLLNTIFNIGRFVAQSEIGGGNSEWKLLLGVDKDQYRWNVITEEENNQILVKSENLFLNNKPILNRELGEIIFNENTTVKLPRNVMAISLLQEEELIKPLFNGFQRILRRRFFLDELQKNAGIYAINQKLLEQLGEKKDLFEIYKAELALNLKLYLLSTFFPEIYEKIINKFRETFGFITEIEIIDSSAFDLINIPGRAPIFCIKELSVDEWIRLDEFSSGMQKVLLILADLFALPSGSIYLIDEYENSLGIGPIGLLPADSGDVVH